MRISLSILILTALPLVASAQVLYVDANAPAGGDGSSWTLAFSDLQDALTTATAGTQVWVAAGTYTPAPVGSLAVSFELASGVEVYGGFSGIEVTADERDPVANETILSGDLAGDDSYSPLSGWVENSDHVVRITGAAATTVLDGFSIIDGGGSTGGGLNAIGGSPTITRCNFRYNLATWGGGVYLDDCNASVTSCTFSFNQGWLGRGAGMHVAGTSSPTITDCTFSSNKITGGTSTAAGAGIYIWTSGTTVIEHCDFLYNIGTNPIPTLGSNGAYGAGIYVLGGAVTVDRCRFIGNSAHAGAGIYNRADGMVVTNCLFQDNLVFSFDTPVVSQGGGGAGIFASAPSAPRQTFIDGCTFVENQGSEGVGAMSFIHELVVTNSIFWGNTATATDLWGHKKNLKGNTTIEYCCVEELFIVQPGEDPLSVADFPGSLDVNPQLDASFVPAAGSPVIDAGNSDTVTTAFDLDGEVRIQDDLGTTDAGPTSPAVDMGCYEFPGVTPVVTFVRADCNIDGASDISDPIHLLDVLFSGGTASSCDDACDANDDGGVNIADAVFILVMLFSSGVAPAEPWPACGADPTADPLECAAFAICP